MWRSIICHVTSVFEVYLSSLHCRYFYLGSTQVHRHISASCQGRQIDSERNRTVTGENQVLDIQNNRNEHVRHCMSVC